jgi:hypothetical protein
MDILIVICRVHTAAHTGLAAGCDLEWGERQAEIALFKMTVCKVDCSRGQRKSGAAQTTTRDTAFILLKVKRRLLVVLGLEDFTTTIEAVRANVVTQMRFTGRRLDTELRHDQEVVRTVHAALGGGLLILLNCHDDS